MKNIPAKLKVLVLLYTLTAPLCYPQNQRVWLDTDTGNEMDDLYAIVRLVKDTSIDVTGISSAHFNNPDLLVFEKWNAYSTEVFNTVAESQRLNEEILQAMNRSDIPHPIGADRQIGRAWGQQDPRDSPAAQGIIAAVKALPEGNKLDILAIGAVTNVATAITLAPEIIPYIRCFLLGARYDAESGVWNKNEFNVRNDLNGFDLLLDCDGLDLTIMPLQAAFPLQFRRDVTYARLNETVEVEEILENRWREQNPQDEIRIMWDLALVEAYLNPDMARVKQALTPPENTQRLIRVYTKIEEKTLEEDFWKILKKPITHNR